jgi:hypothetical protein
LYELRIFSKLFSVRQCYNLVMTDPQKIRLVVAGNKLQKAARTFARVPSDSPEYAKAWTALAKAAHAFAHAVD